MKHLRYIHTYIYTVYTFEKLERLNPSQNNRRRKQLVQSNTRSVGGVGIKQLC